MKRNMDLVRDILLCVEETTTPCVKWEYRYGDRVPERLRKYTQEEVEYHVDLCAESGLLRGAAVYNGGLWIDVKDLTSSGHDFLANIRKDSVWKKVKDVAEGASLSVIASFAEKCIRTQLGL